MDLTILANWGPTCALTGQVELRWTPTCQPTCDVWRSTVDPFYGFVKVTPVGGVTSPWTEPVGTMTKAFYYVTDPGGSLPSNRVGFVKISCPALTVVPFGLPFTFWDVVGCVPAHPFSSTFPSDVIGEQLTIGLPATADVVRSQTTWDIAFRNLAGVWFGPLETSGGMTPGHAFWIYNNQVATNQEMVLAGEVDVTTPYPSPITIDPNTFTPLSFRMPQLQPVSCINLLTCGFRGGLPFTSDRLIDQNSGAWTWFNTPSSTWVGSLTHVIPGHAYWIEERNGFTWSYTYGFSPVPPPPDRPDDDAKMVR